MAYLYAKKGANLMLVARREERLKAISDKSRSLGAKNVHVIVADVTAEYAMVTAFTHHWYINREAWLPS